MNSPAPVIALDHPAAFEAARVGRKAAALARARAAGLPVGAGVVLTIVLATEFGFLQRLLGTVSLTADQWVVCIGVAVSLIVVEEVRKLLKISTLALPATAPVAEPA